MDRKTTPLRLAFLAILLFLFWNVFLPAAKEAFYYEDPHLNTFNVDFNAYYRGGRAFLQGQDPYAGTTDGQPFIYPPTFIPLYAQLARLDYTAARTVWVVIYSLCFLITLLLLTLSVTPPDRDKILFTAGFIVMVSFPVVMYIRQGQIDVIVGSLCFSGLLLYLRRQPNLSAICLAIATLIKLNPLFFMITFVVFFRDWKYLGRYAAAVTILAAGSLLFFPVEWYRIFFMTVLPGLTTGIAHALNQSLLRLIAGDVLVTRILTVSGLGVFTLLAWFIGNRQRSRLRELGGGNLRPFNQFLAMTFFFCNGLVIALFSGSTWVMTYTWFILPATWMVVFLFNHGRYWLLAAVSLGVIMLNGLIIEAKYWVDISMGGGLLCLVCLLAVLFFPGMGLNQSPDLLDTTLPQGESVLKSSDLS